MRVYLLLEYEVRALVFIKLTYAHVSHFYKDVIPTCKTIFRRLRKHMASRLSAHVDEALVYQLCEK